MFHTNCLRDIRQLTMLPADEDISRSVKVLDGVGDFLRMVALNCRIQRDLRAEGVRKRLDG